MDIRRLALGSLFVVALLARPPMEASGRPPEGARLIGGTQQEHQRVDWALERYRAAGLELPPVEIHFHRDPTGWSSGSSRKASISSIGERAVVSSKPGSLK